MVQRLILCTLSLCTCEPHCYLPARSSAPRPACLQIFKPAKKLVRKRKAGSTLSLSAFTESQCAINTATRLCRPQFSSRLRSRPHQPRRLNESFRYHFAGTSSTVVVLVLLQQSGGLLGSSSASRPLAGGPRPGRPSLCELGKPRGSM
jgi:hypothetical protein